MINEAERRENWRPGNDYRSHRRQYRPRSGADCGAEKLPPDPVVPDKMSREKIFHLRALGATVLLTRSDVNKGHPAYYRIMPTALPMKRRAPLYRPV